MKELNNRSLKVIVIPKTMKKNMMLKLQKIKLL